MHIYPPLEGAYCYVLTTELPLLKVDTYATGHFLDRNPSQRRVLHNMTVSQNSHVPMQTSVLHQSVY